MDGSANSEPTDTQEAPVELRVLLWVKIAGELVALLYVIDVVTHGELSERVRWHWRRIRARLDQQRAMKKAEADAVFEAEWIVEREAT